jgi:hypothetical protein
MLNESIVNKVFTNLSTDPHWEKLTKLNHNWQNDPIFQTYHKQGNKQKGTNGEYVVENFFRALGKDVVATRDSEYQGTDFDMVVDGYKTEVKFSLANSKGEQINVDRFIINHVGIEKRWDRLVFCGINPEGSSTRVHMYFAEKKAFEDYINSFVVLARETNDIELRKKIFKSCVFKPQQGGFKTLNDDYMCTSFSKLIELPFIKPIDMW